MDIKRILTGLLKGLLAFIILVNTVLIFSVGVKYFHPNFEVGYLLGKKHLFPGPFSIALYGHVLLTPIIILTGAIQIFLNSHKRWIQIHRFIGKIYVYAILIVGAPSGLVMSYMGIDHWLPKVSFLLLSILWFGFTLFAVRQVLLKQITSHQQWMIRSYILSCSAIVLRMLMFICHVNMEFIPEDTYALISVLSWLPFLLIYELYLWFSKKTKKSLL